MPLFDCDLTTQGAGAPGVFRPSASRRPGASEWQQKHQMQKLLRQQQQQQQQLQQQPSGAGSGTNAKTNATVVVKGDKEPSGAPTAGTDTPASPTSESRQGPAIPNATLRHVNLRKKVRFFRSILFFFFFLRCFVLFFVCVLNCFVPVWLFVD